MEIIMVIDEDKAILDGKNYSGEVIFTYDPANLNAEQREEIIKSRKIYKDHKHLHVLNNQQTSKISEPTLDNLKKALDERIEARKVLAEKEKHELEKTRNWFLNLDITGCYEIDEYFGHADVYEKVLNHVFDNSSSNLDNDITLTFSARYAADKLNDEKMLKKLKELRCLINVEKEKKRAELKEKNTQRINLQNEKEKKYKEEKTRQIEDFIKKHGTDSQKDRLKDGFLPEIEAIDAIGTKTFETLDNHFKIFHVRDEICTCGDEDCKVEHDVEEITTLTSDEYDLFLKIKQFSSPDMIYTFKAYHYNTTYCEYQETIKAIEICAKVGVFEFSKEYELTQGDE